jgi:RNA 2',3'-cyclic 3'-phosphodiesterase
VQTKRLFVAIDLPETIKHLLAELDPRLSGARWVGAEQMHLTLGFFGDVAEAAEAALIDRLAAIEFKSFFLPIRGLGTFPPKGPPKIIWVGVGTGHPHLFQVHKRVQEAALAAGLEPDLRPWHPHITLARCRDVPPQIARKFLERTADFDAGMFRVEQFHLYSSKLTSAGSIYTPELTCLAVNSAN